VPLFLKVVREFLADFGGVHPVNIRRDVKGP
jgi:hypothetical protein